MTRNNRSHWSQVAKAALLCLCWLALLGSQPLRAGGGQHEGRAASPSNGDPGGGTDPVTGHIGGVKERSRQGPGRR